MQPTAERGADPAGPATADRTFRLALGVIAAAALLIRIAISVARPDPLFITDATYYRYQGLLIAKGHGFADPFVWVMGHRLVPTAFHPPLMSLIHAVPNLFGMESVMTGRMITSVIGTITVVAIGLLGRDIGSTRVGLVAATLAALSPNLIAPDTNLNSEGLAACLVALSLLAAYRLIARPRVRTAVAFGVALGLATLTRPEMLALGLIVMVPLVFRHSLTGRVRVGLLAAVAIPVVLLVLPWTIRSLTAFADPVPFSTNGISVVGVANCPSTYGGDRLGAWSAACPEENQRLATDRPDPNADESQHARRDADLGTAYLRRHTATFFTKVVWARIGRTFSVYDPFNLSSADADEGKMRWEVVLGVPYFWASLAFAAVGVVRLRRTRAAPVLPLIGPANIAAIVSVMAYGTPRFRVMVEPSVAVLAAIGACWLWDRYVVRPAPSTA